MPGPQKTLVFLLALATAGSAQDTLWTKTYGGAMNDVAYGVCPAFGGGYVIAGLTESNCNGPQDGYLVRINENGDTLWTRRYGGSGYDAFHGIIRTTDGNFIASGFTSSYGAGGKDIWLVKIAPNGDTVWSKTYGRNLEDCSYTARETTDHGFVLAGYIDGPSGWIKGDLWLIKTDPDGDTLWTRRYGGSGEDFGLTVDTVAGGYAVAGINSSWGAGGKDAWLLKTTLNGDTIWTRTYGLPQEDVGYGLCRTPDAGFIVVGYVNGSGAWTAGDLWIIRADQEGNTVWTRIYGTAGEDFSWSVQPAANDGYVCAGQKGVSSGNLWLLRINESGDTLWTLSLGGNQLDGGAGLAVTPDGGYVCAGYKVSSGTGYADFYVIKTVPEAMIEERSSTRLRPHVGTTIFARNLRLLRKTGMIIFDISGSVVSGNEPGSGVYFYRSPEQSGKLIVVK